MAGKMRETSSPGSLRKGTTSRLLSTHPSEASAQRAFKQGVLVLPLLFRPTDPPSPSDPPLPARPLTPPPIPPPPPLPLQSTPPSPTKARHSDF